MFGKSRYLIRIGLRGPFDTSSSKSEVIILVVNRNSTLLGHGAAARRKKDDIGRQTPADMLNIYLAT